MPFASLVGLINKPKVFLEDKGDTSLVHKEARSLVLSLAYKEANRSDINSWADKHLALHSLGSGPDTKENFHILVNADLDSPAMETFVLVSTASRCQLFFHLLHKSVIIDKHEKKLCSRARRLGSLEILVKNGGTNIIFYLTKIRFNLQSSRIRLKMANV